MWTNFTSVKHDWWQGRSGRECKVRIQKAHLDFLSVSKIWATKRNSRKYQALQISLKPSLMFSSGTCRIAKAIIRKIQSFMKKFLRKILKNILVISNKELRERLMYVHLKRNKIMEVDRPYTQRVQKYNHKREFDMHFDGQKSRDHPRVTWQREMEV